MCSNVYDVITDFELGGFIKKTQKSTKYLEKNAFYFQINVSLITH